jgi:monoamine oxidase
MSSQEPGADQQPVDVLVVGGGLAGVVAARDIARAGLNPVLLESSGRLGGRAFVREFPGTSFALEYGGTWVIPDKHRFVMDELARYRIATEPSPLPSRFRARRDGQLREGFTAPVAELAKFKSQLDEATSRSDWADCSVYDFAERVGVDEHCRAWLEVYCTFLSGAQPDSVSVGGLAGTPLEFYINLEHYNDKIVGTTRNLVTQIATDHAFPVVYDSHVVSIRSHAAQVYVQDRRGRGFRGRWAVIATPASTWPSIHFSPALSAAAVTSAQANMVSRSVKVWLLVDGITDYIRVVDFDGPLSYLRVEALLSNRTALVVGFGVEPTARTISTEYIAEVVAAVFDRAQLLAADWHDWNGDERFLGTWSRYHRTRGTNRTDALARLVFAGADLADSNVGSLDGAIETGRRAACTVVELDSAERESHGVDQP